jgi:hypothetical protein
MAYSGTPAALELPPELAGVPPAVLKVRICDTSFELSH